MREKCDANLALAEFLSQNADIEQCWTACAHCSYYAVFQYMKYILAVKSNPFIPYNKQNESKTDSHNYILDEIKNRINNPRIARRIYDKVRVLKRWRVLADYEDKFFSQEEAIDCKDQAEGLIRELKSIFCA